MTHEACWTCGTPAVCAERRVCAVDNPGSAENPKEQRAAADGKAPLEYLESGATDAGEARVMKHGADKYGVKNYTATSIRYKTYIGALRRHLNALADGEDADPDSGENHLFHIRACTTVLLAAQREGTLLDDRLMVEVMTPAAGGRGA